MSNIGTIHLRCFRRLGQTRRIRARALRRWLCRKGSYYVPVWSQDRLRAGVVDFQYGAPHGSLLSLRDRLRNLNKLFSMIWVRVYNDSGDEEAYYLFKDGRVKHWAGPYYGYDEIQVKLTAEASYSIGAHFTSVGAYLWRRDIQTGRYHAMNSRVVWSRDLTLPTPTTETSDTYLSDLPQQLPEVIQAIYQNNPQGLVYIDLFWRGRRVKRIQLDAHLSLRQYCCDHWDNFTLSDYQDAWQTHQAEWRL